MHRNAAERQAALSFLTNRGQTPGAGTDPRSVQQWTFYPEALCVSTSAGTYRVMSVLDEFSREGEGPPRLIATGLGVGKFGSRGGCGKYALSKSNARHVVSCRELGQVA